MPARLPGTGIGWPEENKMKPTNPNAHTYVYGTNVITHGLFEQSCACFPCYQSAVWSGKCRVWSAECESKECGV